MGEEARDGDGGWARGEDAGGGGDTKEQATLRQKPEPFKMRSGQPLGQTQSAWSNK